MIESHDGNVKLSVSQVDKLKSATKNGTGVTLRLSSVTIGTDKTKFLQKALLKQMKVKQKNKGV